MERLRQRMGAEPSSLLALVDGKARPNGSERNSALVRNSDAREVAAVRDILTGNPGEAIAKLTALEAEKPGS